MRTLLLNSAVIPHNFNGICQYETLTEEQFVDCLLSSENVESFLGYQDTITHIKNISTHVAAFNRDVFHIDNEEPVKCLVCRLLYRVEPSSKGHTQTVNSWDYGKMVFIPNYNLSKKNN